jgi:hypothetical protein
VDCNSDWTNYFLALVVNGFDVNFRNSSDFWLEVESTGLLKSEEV